MAYTKTNWVNQQEPPINAQNLNKIEDALEEAFAFIDFDKSIEGAFVRVGAGGDFPTVNDAWNAGNRKLYLLSGAHDLTSNLNYSAGDEPFHIMGSGKENTTLNVYDFKMTFTGFTLPAAATDGIFGFTMGSDIATFSGNLNPGLIVGSYVTPSPDYLNQTLILKEIGDGTVLFDRVWERLSTSDAGVIFQNEAVRDCEFSSIKIFTDENDSNSFLASNNIPFLNFSVEDCIVHIRSTVGLNRSINYDSYGRDWRINNSDFRNSRIYCPWGSSIKDTQFAKLYEYPGNVFENCLITDTIGSIISEYVTMINCHFLADNLLTVAPEMRTALIGCSDITNSVYNIYYTD